mmetsp:Transcript_93340/g.278696  ORF Transcript_93340/g.278696 Transcript_93340/m.278696 type:complete len:474 (+) Transcript_93340:151-1572(+)
MGSSCALEHSDVDVRNRAHAGRPARTCPPSRVGQTHEAALGAGSGGGRNARGSSAFETQDLLAAAMAGDGRSAARSLQERADPNAAVESTQLCALHLASSQGHVGVARMLLEHQADIAAMDNALGLSPLSMACLAGHAGVARLLVCAAAPLDAPEGDGGAPLLHAARRNFPEACEVLVAAAANVNVAIRGRHGRPHLEDDLDGTRVATGWQLSPPTGDPTREPLPLRAEGSSPLHFAAHHGSLRVCQRLLEAGARPGAMDAAMRTPLMFAAHRGHSQAAALLLDYQAVVGTDSDGHSAATLAACAGHGTVVRVLLEMHAVAVDHVPRAGGASMLHAAVHHGHGGCARLLCDCHADVGVMVEPRRLRPLMVAAAHGWHDICRDLLAHKAAVDETDSKGRTAWSHAAGAGHVGVCRLLTNHGAVEHVAQDVAVWGHGAAARSAAASPPNRRAEPDLGCLRPAVASAVVVPNWSPP